MKKAIGILCITIAIASLGWKLSQAALTVKSDASLIDIGYLKASENTVIQIKNGTANAASSGVYSVNKPINYQIDGAISILASMSCWLAGITLLKKESI